MTKEELELLHLPGEDTPARLASLDEKIRRDRQIGFTPPRTGEVNNHVHTVYSFSPYTPAEVVYAAWRAGLEAVGIVDHESVAGFKEMQEAAKRIGMAVTSGCELRVSTEGTPLEGRRLNNPDSVGIAYIIIHGLPKQGREEAEAFLSPIRQSHFARMGRQNDTLNGILRRASLPELDFNRDVLPLTRLRQGGTVSERHLLYALAGKLVQNYKRGQSLIRAIEIGHGLRVPDAIARKLLQEDNPHILYDLLGFFKGFLVPLFYEEPDAEECPPVARVVALAERTGGIACYPYLGDVAKSPTGDKKAEKYEDEWLDLLFDTLPQLGFQALAYMPPRNTMKQLRRVKSMCTKKNLMEISGVDINSSRQEFRCPEVAHPEFIHLNESTWALIAHEHLVSGGAFGLFDSRSPLSGQPLKVRLEKYAHVGRKMNASNPQSIMEAARREGLWA